MKFSQKLSFNYYQISSNHAYLISSSVFCLEGVQIELLLITIMIILVCKRPHSESMVSFLVIFIYVNTCTKLLCYVFGDSVRYDPKFNLTIALTLIQIL